MNMISFIRKNRIRCIVAVFYQIFMSVVVVRNALLTGGTVSFESCWFLSFGGNLEIGVTNADKFELPVLWIIFHAYIFYMLCDQLHDHSVGIGIQRLIRIGSRRKWYFQVCRMDAEIIFFYYLCYFFILQIVLKIQNIPMDLNMAGVVLRQYVAACFFLPVCCSISIFFIQNVVSLYCSKYVAYVISLAILVCSSYWRAYYLIGNYAILLRMDFYRNSGLHVPTAFMICLAIMIFTLLVGLKKAGSRDFIEKELEER